MKLLLLVATLGFAGVSLGMDCSPFARPWMVYFSSGQTGVLLNEWWVLTKMSYHDGSQQMLARLGVDDINGQSNSEQQIAVDEWINHDPYSGYRRKRSPLHDLALVRLAQPARLTPQVQPVALPTQCPKAGELCVATSYGRTTGSTKQQCLVQEVLSNSVCRALNPMHWSPQAICTASHPSAEGNCMSGNSMLVCGGVLQGVDGFRWISEGCSAGKPSTYSKVCLYRNWIDDIMSSMTPTTTPPTTTSTPPPRTTPPCWSNFVS